MAAKLHNLLCYCIIILLLFQSLHSEEDIQDNEDEMNIIDENLENVDIVNEGSEIEEEQVTDPNLEQLYVLLQRMYSSITHGDSRYFSIVIKELKNETFVQYLDDENIMEAIETNFIHILNTMHLVSEIAIKIHATPMYVPHIFHLFIILLFILLLYFSGKSIT